MICKTKELLLGAKKHYVALDPQQLVQVMARRNTISHVEITDYHYRHPRRLLQHEYQQGSWIGATVAFFTACSMYGLGAYSFVRYIFSLLHIADGLMHVDTVMREHYGRLSAVDWSFFGPVGLTTASVEIYALLLTFLMMIRQYDAMIKLGGNEAWDRFLAFIHFLMACGSLVLVLLFFYFSTGYHCMIIDKVLSLSPNGTVALQLFYNSTTGLVASRSRAAILF